MTIVVIGGTGLIGSKTVAILRQVGNRRACGAPTFRLTCEQFFTC
jgi:uncharacterized protein YbjT (DUF2867 family)